jgi:hypothetical protein
MAGVMFPAPPFTNLEISGMKAIYENRPLRQSEIAMTIAFHFRRIFCNEWACRI